KQSNDVTRLQALVDKMKVVVTEAAIRDALHLDDAEGVDCLPNEEIFTTLARMGYEKPSTKLTFYKAFFSSLWKFLTHDSTIDEVGKGCSGVETSLFEGMLVVIEPEEQGDAEEQGNDDNAAEEPVTAEALDTCAALARRVEHLEHDKVAQNLEITKLKTRVKMLERSNKRIESSDDTIMEDVSNQGRMIEELDKDEGAELMNEKEEKDTKEVQDITGNAQVEGRQAEIYQIDMDHAAKVLKVVAAVSETVSAAVVVPAVVTETVSAAAVVHAVVTETVSAATVVPTVAPVKVVVPSTRRRKRVVIRDPEEESSAKTPTKTKSKDKGKCIMVEEPKPIKKKQQVELDDVYARKLQEELNQDIDWEVAIDHVKQKAKEKLYVQSFKMDYFKGMSYDDILLIFKAKFNFNIEFILKSKEQMEEEENRAIASINETPAQKAAKRRRLNEEAKDVKELKQHLEIMPDEDDDVYTEATPLARKVPVVDYQIIHFNNKPHYKIIRADETHQLYFWNTVAVKQSNDITRLQALVDKMKVVVTEAAIRDALHLDDAEGIDCLPNEEIFTTLARMGYEKPSTKLTFYKAFFSSQWKFLTHTILQSISAKRTSWNEFSLPMASAVICLSTCRKFNFSKYIFESLVRNVESSSKFYMYHRVGKGCSGVETSLFEGMLVVREPEEQGDAKEQGNDDNAAEEPVTAVDDEDQRVEHLEHDKVAQNLEITKLKTRVKMLERSNKVKTLKLRRLRKIGTSQRNESSDDTIMEDVSNQGRMIEELDKDKGAELMNEKEEKDTEEKSLLLKRVVIRDPEEESSAKTPTKTKSKDKGKGIMVDEPKPIKKKQQVELDDVYARKLQEELNQDIDWEVTIDHVKQKAKEKPYVQRYQVMNKIPQTEAQAQRNMMMYLKNTASFKMDYFKGMSYDDILPIFEAKFNSNIEFLLKSKEQMEEEENRAIASINETPAQKAAKRRRLNEEAEDVKELK
nr:synaptobrevin, longin-like domain protein [Tanacetum cinerariifolium]